MRLFIFFSVFNCNVNIKENILIGCGGICGSNCGNINIISKCVVNVNGYISLFAGGICGYNINTISKCIVKGDISGVNAGGICGCHCSNTSTISKCIVKGDISGVNAGCICANGCDVIGTISKCSVKGNISGEYAGGITGTYCNDIDTISKCKFIGNITNRGAGIIGAFYHIRNLVNTTIEKCHVNARLSGQSGGIIGYTFNFGGNDNKSLIINDCRSVGHCDHTSANIIAPIIESDTLGTSITVSNCEYSNVITREIPVAGWTYTVTNCKKVRK